MRAVLFYALSTAAAVMYLLVSSALLFRKLVSRWVLFTLVFFIAYPAASYAFIGIVPSYVGELWAGWKSVAPSVLLFMLIAGTVSCIGYGLFRHFCFRQILGLEICFMTLLACVAYSAGVLRLNVDVERLLMSLPFILFYVGVPSLLGWLMWQGYTLRAAAGLLTAFLSVLCLLSIGVTNYFDRPFAFIYELAPQTKFWIELATLGCGVIGLVVIVGHGMFNGEWSIRRVIGALVVFAALMSVVVVLVQLTIGYRYVPALFSAANH